MLCSFAAFLHMQRLFLWPSSCRYVEFYVPVDAMSTTWESMFGRQNDSNRGSVKSTTSSSPKLLLLFLDPRSSTSSTSLSFFLMEMSLPECVGDEQPPRFSDVICLISSSCGSGSPLLIPHWQMKSRLQFKKHKICFYVDLVDVYIYI